MEMRKINILFLLIFLYAGTVFSQENIALNKPVITSTVANATYPKYLNDGNSSTVWNSNTNAIQWIQIDLLNVYDLSNITILWGTTSAGHYSISTSSNAKDWTEVSLITSSDGSNTKSLDIAKSTVRYIRIDMSVPGASSGYAISEVTLSGTLSTVTVEPSLNIVPKNDFIALGYTKPHILSINNSLIDRNDQPTIFNPLAVSAGKNAVWEKQTRLGQSLRYHYEEGDGLLTDGTPTAKYRIRTEDWTHIILQEQSDKPLTNYADFLASVKLWVNYIRANCPNPNVRIILDMNWPYTDAVDFEGDMTRLWNNYMMVAAETGVSVYPVGKAYSLILNTDGVSVKDALYTDNRHPSVMASYLSACTVLAALYEINPEGIAYYPSGLTLAQAQLMQTRAKEASLTVTNTCDVNGKIHFSAELVDQYNRPLTNSDPVVWSVTGGGTIDNTGNFTSNTTPGIYTVTVTKGSVNASTNFEVKSLLVYPQISTQAMADVGANSATAHGAITILGNPTPTQYGHCWSTTPAPTILNSKTTNGIATSEGTFTSTISGLNTGTTYYVRAYITNSTGTYYGSEVVFTTTSNSSGQLVTLLTQSTPGTYTWTCPDGVNSVLIECWGGGGAGGGSKNLGLGSSSINANCGGGGAGGSYVKHVSVSVSPGTVYSYTVGAGGTGVTANRGNDGGNTTFNNTTIVAFGGGGGSVSSIDPTTNLVIPSTQGGVCQTPTTGTTNYAGGSGGNSKNSTGYYSGGGGGAADSGGVGHAASSTTITGGTAGTTGGGAGGNGIFGTGAFGNAGSVIGGGGAGSSTGQGDTNRAGGAGAAGKIVISTLVITGFSEQIIGEPILVYPNPATNRVQTSTEVAEIALYSLQGQLVCTNRNTSSVDISGTTKGMYIVRLTDKKGYKQSVKIEIR